MTLISIVVPCYNEEESIPLFAQELDCVVRMMMADDETLSFELILVDDGSSDQTLQVMKACESSDFSFQVRWLSFSRNFGKEAALYAGLKAARGSYVATMDADMQDPPSLLPEMFRILKTEDVDNVAMRRTTRQGEPLIRSFFARMFYRIINKISNADIVDGARDYRLMRRIMVDAVLSLGEYNRFSKGIFGWVGFKTYWFEYENVERMAGETKWSFSKLFAYSLDGIVGFSTVPLSIASVAGIACCLLAIVFMLIIIVRALVFGDPVAGWPSLITVILLLGGVQLLCLGVLGMYLSKTYLETKKRPLYIVRDSNED